MMRPADWMPLAPADPLPGDPDAITVEAVRLSLLGEDMRTQATRLRDIGADSTLIGAYATELRSASTDLAQDLDKVADRYERVGSALKGWAPQLTVAQDETLRARAMAMEAEQLRASITGTPNWGDPWTHLELVPTLDSAALHEAKQLFFQAQRTLRDTLEHARASGHHYASLIDDANDIFKDGRWDNFKDWADRNADWIDAVSKQLGNVATVAAIAAIFIPGANVVAFGYLATALGTTAIVATGAATVGHLTLASTGNGSWVDVGFDVVALLTIGVGLRAGKALERAQAATRAAASVEAGESASQAVVRSRWEEIQRLDTIARRLGTTAAQDDALRVMAEVNEQAARAGSQAARALMEAPLPATTLAGRMTIGERGLASMWDDVVAQSARFPASATVSEAAERAGSAYRVAHGGYMAATTSDLVGRNIDTYAARWPFTRTGSTW